MEVSELLVDDALQERYVRREIFSLVGWLVILDDKVYVLDRKFEGGVRDAKFVQIENFEIIYPVVNRVVLVADLESCVCHRVKAIGCLTSLEPITFQIEELWVDERWRGFFRVDISESNVKQCQARHYDLIGGRKQSSGDWLDFYLGGESE